MIFVLWKIDYLSIDVQLWTCTTICPNYEAKCTEPELIVYGRYSLSIENSMEIQYLVNIL